MKRVITFLLATVLLASACFVTPISADSYEDHLIMNFDFNEGKRRKAAS